METPPLSSPAYEKFKASFGHGVTSNLFTMGGVSLSWILLVRSGWIEGFWGQVWTALCLAPVFMGDALNSYVLGRIRLEAAKGWDDICITPEGSASLLRFHLFWRGLSLAAAVLLALSLLSGFAPDPSIGRSWKILFLAVFSLHAVRSIRTTMTAFAPRLPPVAASGLVRKGILAACIGAALGIWIWAAAEGPWSTPGLLFTGSLYFVLCGALQPLPSRFSLFRRDPLSAKPRRVLEVAVLTPEEADRLVDGVLRQDADAWIQETGCRSLGFLRMPLLELPLFEAVGQALIDGEDQTLILVLQSEVRNRRHVTLVSGVGTKTLVTTDFGAKDARFPPGFVYQTLPVGQDRRHILQAHRSRREGPVGTVPQPPWAFLIGLVDAMIAFLHRSGPGATPTVPSPANPPVEGFPADPASPDAGMAAADPIVSNPEGPIA